MVPPEQTKNTTQSRVISCRKNTKHAQFPLFGKLPIEIQLRIWLLSDAVVPPTTIVPSWTPNTKEIGYKRKVPVVLQVCQWTRGEFKTKDGQGKVHMTWTLIHGLNASGGIYVSLEHDEVVVAQIETLSLVALQKVHNLVLTETIAYQIGTFKPQEKHTRSKLQLCPNIVRFKNLSTLTLVFMTVRFYAMLEEKDDQIDAEGVWGMEGFLKYRKKVLSLLEECGKENTDWNLPALKLRTVGQFCSAKRIRLGPWTRKWG